MPGPIPHTVSDHVCIDFVNSRFTDHTGTGAVHDRLGREEWQRWYADRCGILLERPPSAAAVRRAADVRAVLRRLLESTCTPEGSDLTELNQILAATGIVHVLTRGSRGIELRQVWQHQDWHAVMAATVASYGQLISTGGLRRVRRCGNPNCTFIFHDESRNRTRRWCEAATCGNLVKVRRHRARVPLR